jgi:hypothetical protein
MPKLLALFLLLTLAPVALPADVYDNDDSETASWKSCWSRRQWATGTALNPNKLIAQQQAQRNYVTNAKSYGRYCPADQGCQLKYPAPSFPFCTGVGGKNWQCQVSEEISCWKPSDS